MDAQARAGLHSLLRAASERVAGPTIYVTHDLVDAREFAQIAVVFEGKALKATAHPQRPGDVRISRSSRERASYSGRNRARASCPYSLETSASVVWPYFSSHDGRIKG